MRANEKKAMLETYKQQFKWHLESGSDIAQIELRGMRTLLTTVLSKEEVNRAENECRTESNYIKELFENVETQIKNLKIDYMLTWELKDVQFIVEEAQFSKEVNEEAWRCLQATVSLLENEREKGKVA